MVKVETARGSTYCIDATEVTNGDYAEFLASNPSAPGQGSPCESDPTFVPHAHWPRPGKDDYPVNWVDWCDARAYCAFAGKRLCGRVGGGPVSPDDVSPNSNEWINACSHQGQRTYAYGNDVDLGACNVGSTPLEDLSEPVSSRPACEGGFPGIFDLGGNVSEWTDDCADGFCPTQAPNFLSSDGACTTHFGSVADFDAALIGIRCCRDAE